MKERLLFRSDLEGVPLRLILELRPKSARLLAPSYPALRTARLVPLLMYLGYLGLLLAVLSVLLGRGDLISAILGTIAVVAVFGGFVRLYGWRDRANLPILAEEPGRAREITILGVAPRRKVTELRVRIEETEARVTVYGTRNQVEEALQFAGIAASPS